MLFPVLIIEYESKKETCNACIDYLQRRLGVSTVISRSRSGQAQLQSSHKENGMITIDSCSKQDVDRLLGLADQFLDDWAEDAVQGGKRDENYEQRSTEWKAIRPLLLFAPAMLKGLKEVAHFSQDSSDPIAMRCAAVARTSLGEFLKEVAA
jgi:hypothetical protein